MGGKASEADDLGRQIMGGDGAPGGVCASSARGGPKRLPFVEVSSRPGPEALRNQSRPVDPRHLGGEVRDRRKRVGCGLRNMGRGLEPCEVRRAQRRRRASERVGQIGIGDDAAGDPLLVPVSGHCDRDARHPRQARADSGEAFICLAEERIDRDARR